MGGSPKVIAKFFKERLAWRLIKHPSAYEHPLGLGGVGWVIHHLKVLHEQDFVQNRIPSQYA